MRQVNLEGDKITQNETSYSWIDKLCEKETSLLRMGQIDSEWDKLPQNETSFRKVWQVNSELDKLTQNETS